MARQRDDLRSDARERAMMLLYEAGQRDLPAVDVVEAQVVEPDALTLLLVRGVAEFSTELDVTIAEHAHGWTLDRMPAIDRTVLRIAAFELAHRPDVPTAVVIDEAVELAKRFSTDDSGKFVNGVLSAIARAERGVQHDD